MCAFPKLSSSFWLDAEEAKLWSLTRRRPANQKHLYGKSCGGEGNLSVLSQGTLGLGTAVSITQRLNQEAYAQHLTAKRMVGSG